MNTKTVVPFVATLLAGAVAVHYANKKKKSGGKDETSTLPEGHKDLEGLETIVSPPQEDVDSLIPGVTNVTAVNSESEM